MTTNQDTAHRPYIVEPGGGEPIERQAVHIKASTELTGGHATVLEVFNAGFGGPPLHIHRRHGEMYYVLEGDYLLQLEDEVTTVPAGSFAYAAPGVRHTFASAGKEPGRLLIIGVPGGLETYVREIDRLLAKGADEDAIRRLGEEWDTELVGPQLSPQ
jgi:quercetin dioxygenase-like cupin family protein